MARLKKARMAHALRSYQIQVGLLFFDDGPTSLALLFVAEDVF